MIDVRLAELEELVNEVADAAGYQVHVRRSGGGDAQSLFVSSGLPGTPSITLTTLEPGTLFFELSSGHRADWLVRDESDLGTMRDELRAMLQAVFAGRISVSGVLRSDGRKFRLGGGGLLGRLRLRSHRRPYPSA